MRKLILCSEIALVARCGVCKVALRAPLMRAARLPDCAPRDLRIALCEASSKTSWGAPRDFEEHTHGGAPPDCLGYAPRDFEENSLRLRSAKLG